MDAIELLLEQHHALEELLESLAEASPDQRASTLAEVADELALHILAEEQVFYPAVRAKRTEDILLESLEEHLSLKRLLADLLELPTDDDTFDAKVDVLKEQAEHHHEEEEEHLFPKVRQLIAKAERKKLGDEMWALQQRLLQRGRPRDEVARATDKAASLE